jgi:S-DNA-T family DNA segregation ATPase FtsK/SpoIIIE
MFSEAVKIVCQYERASASLLQRRLSIGYARAARVIDQLEAAGVIAPSDGSSKPREVLIKNPEEFLSGTK